MICRITSRGVSIDGKEISRLRSAQVIEILMLKKGFVNKEELMDWIFPIDKYYDDPPLEKNIEVNLCHARTFLKEHGIKIENRYGMGWRIINKPRVVVAA